MTRFLTATVLSIALLAPSLARADGPREWNEEHEGAAYRSYLNEHHRKSHDWNKASKSEQRNYWKWRDAHQGEYH
jgi:hypothetical protein